MGRGLILGMVWKTSYNILYVSFKSDENFLEFCHETLIFQNFESFFETVTLTLNTFP